MQNAARRGSQFADGRPTSQLADVFFERRRGILALCLRSTRRSFFIGLDGHFGHDDPKTRL